MFRSALAVAILMTVISVFVACEPGMVDTRDCQEWFDAQAALVKNPGDDCSGIAEKFYNEKLSGAAMLADCKTDKAPTASCGKAINVNGTLMCAQVVKNAGTCNIIPLNCVYSKNNIYSCYTQCIWTVGAPDASNVCQPSS
jgi:hypothetical protein